MSERARFVNWASGAVGAIVGGALGYFGFFLIARQGFYAIALPGALLGLGCGLLLGMKSNTVGIVCGIFAVLLGIVTEWQFAPFVQDDGFAYFVLHLHALAPVSLIMIGIGGVAGFWFGRGRE